MSILCKCYIIFHDISWPTYQNLTGLLQKREIEGDYLTEY